MKNKTKISGDRNFVTQGNQNSKINLLNKDLPKKRNYALIGLIIPILGLIATVIIGWNNIVNFFAR